MNAKRRLTKQQKIRIEDKQRRHTEPNETSGAVEAALVAHLGRHVICKLPDGTLVDCHLRQSLPPLVAGDRVFVQIADPTPPVVVALGERQNLLYRHTKRGETKPLAANIDCMFIVCAVTPSPSWASVDRYLALAEILHITPILIMNKMDLIDAKRNQLYQEMAYYRSLGYTVLELSCDLKTGLEDVQSRLANQTSIVVGQSGVGKSSILQHLLPDETIAVAEEVDQARATGTHTTTTARMYPLPASPGSIIDSPGVRAFDLQLEGLDTITRGFKDIAALSQACEYRDCKHLHEPHCAVREAVAAGRIQARRLKHFHEMLQMTS